MVGLDEAPCGLHFLDHYSLLTYIPALAQIARMRPELATPPPVTLNSAADVVQNAM